MVNFPTESYNFYIKIKIWIWNHKTWEENIIGDDSNLKQGLSGQQLKKFAFQYQKDFCNL